MRKVICFVILISLMLHCAARIGVLSALYDVRYDIALSLGLIDEKPIASCNSSYFYTKELHIVQESSKMPVAAIFYAQEINLFEPDGTLISVPEPESTPVTRFTHYQQNISFPSTLPVFHPPAA